MNKLIAVLTFPLSLAGSVALILKVYALTSSAQLASAEVVRSFSQLSDTLPKLFLFLGVLIVLGALSVVVIRLAWAAAYRVELSGKVHAMQVVRLAGANSVVGKKLLDSGYHVINHVPVELPVARRTDK